MERKEGSACLAFLFARVAVEERERWINIPRDYRCSLEVSENCLLVRTEKRNNNVSGEMTSPNKKKRLHEQEKEKPFQKIGG